MESYVNLKGCDHRLWGNCFLEARFARMMEVFEITFNTSFPWSTEAVGASHSPARITAKKD